MRLIYLLKSSNSIDYLKTKSVMRLWGIIAIGVAAAIVGGLIAAFVAVPALSAVLGLGAAGPVAGGAFAGA